MYIVFYNYALICDQPPSNSNPIVLQPSSIQISYFTSSSNRVLGDCSINTTRTNLWNRFSGWMRSEDKDYLIYADVNIFWTGILNSLVNFCATHDLGSRDSASMQTPVALFDYYRISWKYTTNPALILIPLARFHDPINDDFSGFGEYVGFAGDHRFEEFY